MDHQNEKCVMVIDEELPTGIIANTAGIMGITLGKKLPETVGPDVSDRNGRSHLGIIAIPVPILKASKEKLKELRLKLYEPSFSELTVVDFPMWRRAALTTTNSHQKPPRQTATASSTLGWASAAPKNWLIN